jgi:hypothetical protein
MTRPIQERLESSDFCDAASLYSHLDPVLALVSNDTLVRFYEDAKGGPEDEAWVTERIESLTTLARTHPDVEFECDAAVVAYITLLKHWNSNRQLPGVIESVSKLPNARFAKALANRLKDRIKPSSQAFLRVTPSGQFVFASSTSQNAIGSLHQGETPSIRNPKVINILSVKAKS